MYATLYLKVFTKSKLVVSTKLLVCKDADNVTEAEESKVGAQRPSRKKAALLSWVWVTVLPYPNVLTECDLVT